MAWSRGGIAGREFSVNGRHAGTTQAVNGVTLTSGTAAISASTTLGAVALNLGAHHPAARHRTAVQPAGRRQHDDDDGHCQPGRRPTDDLGGYAVWGSATTWAVSGSGATAVPSRGWRIMRGQHGRRRQ